LKHSEEVSEAIGTCAARLGVKPDIHDEDFIFQFVMSHPGFNSPADAASYYFDDGRKSADRVSALIARYMPGHNHVRLLEFASGYGCVTRHLAVSARGYELVACDIHQAAVSFTREALGVNAMQSASRPEDVNSDKPFDVVFALSFFSHMPDRTWGRWLRTLLSMVTDGGLLIFTTHGRKSGKHFGNPQVDDQGYFFRPESEQADLATDEYGSTLVLPKYVFRKLNELPDTNLAYFEEGLWWEHQDTYVVQRRVRYQPTASSSPEDLAGDSLAIIHAAITGRDAALTERDVAITGRDAALTQRDVATTARDAALAERDVATTARDAALAERDVAITGRDAALAERDSVFRSNSWRMTAPLRALSSAIRPR
jgi:hypothetical protein